MSSGRRKVWKDIELGAVHCQVERKNDQGILGYILSGHTAAIHSVVVVDQHLRSVCRNLTTTLRSARNQCCYMRKYMKNVKG